MSKPIFPALLGDAFDELPAQLKELHRGDQSAEWHGSATTRGAEGMLGRLVAAVIGFAGDGQQSATRVAIEVTSRGETWTRSIGEKQFRSHMSLGTGREFGLMCERFGIITVALAIVWQDERLWFVPKRWRIGWLPLPKFLMPRGDSFEAAIDGLFAFNVRIELPIFGLIAAYEGKLQRADLTTSPTR